MTFETALGGFNVKVNKGDSPTFVDREQIGTKYLVHLIKDGEGNDLAYN